MHDASFDKKLDLNEAIQYQDDAVVSKIVLKKKTGSVTLFAFDEGQELSEHTTPHEALLQVLDGEAKVTIAGKVFLVKAGEMLILPANVPHAVNAQQKFKMMLMMIRS
ncbi:MAG: cupin domain-containing protein [bacterium]